MTSNMKTAIQMAGAGGVYRGAAALAVAAMLSIPGAFAQEVAAPPAAVPSDSSEIQQFCTNIADAARDQRYVLQKQELEKLQAGVNERIAELEKRRDEYQKWLKLRDEFLNQAKLNLVDIYKVMKPDSAAAQLALVDTVTAAAIIMKLPPRQSSLILSEMKKDEAAVITNILSSAGDPTTKKDPS